MGYMMIQLIREGHLNNALDHIDIDLNKSDKLRIEYNFKDEHYIISSHALYY